MTSMNGPFDGRQDRDERRSGSFMRLFGQMMMLPFTVFIQGMELFIKTIQGIQSATEEGMDVMAGEMTQTCGETPRSQSDDVGSKTSFVAGGNTKDAAEKNLKEERNMPDRNLSD